MAVFGALFLSFLLVFVVFPEHAAAIDNPYAFFTGKDCLEPYHAAIRQKRAALIAVYEEAIEESERTEHMAGIKECTGKLGAIFQWKPWTLTLPGLPDLEIEARALLEKTLEKACEETLVTLKKTLSWETVWRYARKSAADEDIDWNVLSRGMNSVNDFLYERVRSRIGELIR